MFLCSASFRKFFAHSASISDSIFASISAGRSVITVGTTSAGIFVFGFGFGVAFSVDSQATLLAPLSSSEVLLRRQELTPAPWDGKFTETVVKKGSCIISEIYLNVTDAQTGETWPIHTTLYRPDVSEPVPMSLVIPTIDGITILEPRVSSELCESNIAGMIALLRDTTQPKNLPAWGFEDSVDRREILGLRTLLDFASRDSRFDSQRLGIFGMSLGGIITSMMAGLEPERLKAVVIAVGGGDLPHVLAMSDNVIIGTLRQRRMASIGVTDIAEYEALLAKHLRYDPLFFATQANHDRIMMVMSTVDRKVIASTQREQFDAFGKTNYMLSTWDHIETLLQVAYLYMSPLIKFMQSRFDARSIQMQPIAVN